MMSSQKTAAKSHLAAKCGRRQRSMAVHWNAQPLSQLGRQTEASLHKQHAGDGGGWVLSCCLPVSSTLTLTLSLNMRKPIAALTTLPCSVLPFLVLHLGPKSFTRIVSCSWKGPPSRIPAQLVASCRAALRKMSCVQSCSVLKLLNPSTLGRPLQARWSRSTRW